MTLGMEVLNKIAFSNLIAQMEQNCHDLFEFGKSDIIMCIHDDYDFIVVHNLNFRLDDIIVGAPMYSDYSSPDSYDKGRVYIYYQNNKVSF